MSTASVKTGRSPLKKWCDENTGLFFLIPWILGFLIFKAYPFASSLYYSSASLPLYNFYEWIIAQLSTCVKYILKKSCLRQLCITRFKGIAHDIDTMVTDTL